MSLHFSARHHYPGGFELNADFETDAQVTALFGPSGSGKTSILEMIAGLRRADQARIVLDGRCLVDTRSGVSLTPDRRDIGLVAQDQLLFPHLTVRQNLLFGRRRRAADAPRPQRVADVLELTSVLDRRPAQISGGQRQRVALARAILAAPKLLLLDEPLAALDEPLKERILGYLERLLDDWPVPVLFVSHAQQDVRRLARRVVVIDQGRVVGQGPIDETLSEPTPLSWQNALGPTNLLRVDAIQLAGTRVIGHIGSQPVQLPPGQYAATGLMVAFSPRDVILATSDMPGVSARNHLKGRVRRIIELSVGTFVEIDVGQPLWAEITPEAAGELQLRPGNEVICLVKTQSFRLLGDWSRPETQLHRDADQQGRTA